MGKTLADVDLQVRQLIGDFQRVNFTPAQVAEAINWAQDVVMRVKGFKAGSRLYDFSTFPIGDLPPDYLVVKRVRLVAVVPYYTITVTPTFSNPVFSHIYPGSLLNSPLTLTVTINRFNGYSAPIDVRLPPINSRWDGFSLVANGVSVGALFPIPNPYTVTSAPDVFTIQATGVYSGWALSGGTVDTWSNVFVSGISLMNVNSNIFTINPPTISPTL
jgi:hypothetical protein